MTGDRRRLRVSDLDAAGAFHDLDVDSLTGAPPRHVLIQRLPAGDAPGEHGVDRVEVVLEGWHFRFQVEDAQRARLRDRARRAAADHGPATPQTVRAQLPGRVVSVTVSPGDEVAIGDRLLSIEAMKMENEVRAPRAGTVEAVAVTAGQGVELGDELVRIV